MSRLSSNMRSGRRGSSRCTRYENSKLGSEVEVEDWVGSGLKRPQEIQCQSVSLSVITYFTDSPRAHPSTGSQSGSATKSVSGKTPPLRPRRRLRRSTPPRTRGPTRPPEPKVASRRVTLECQTLKVRETVRRSFVTDLVQFRHLCIRQLGGFVTGSRFSPF